MSHPSTTMADVTTLTKGSKVEVSILDEPGSPDAWYQATIVDIVPLSTTTKRQKKIMGYLVRYDTIREEDSVDKKLCETVDPMIVRPLPPKNNVGNGDDDVEEEFKVMDVVDCFYRDGWWSGVVQNVTVGSDDDKMYFVKLVNPDEVFEFRNTKMTMRPHFDWLGGSCWKRAPNKIMQTPKQEVVDKNANPTSKSNVDVQSKRPPSANLDSQSVVGQRSSERKKHLQIKAERDSEIGGVVDGSVTTCKKRSTANLAEVSSSKKIRSSDVKNSGRESNELMVYVKETSGSEAINQDSPLTNEERIMTETCEAENGKKGRGRPPKFTVTRQGLSKGSSCHNPHDHHDTCSDALIPATIVENSGSTEDRETCWPFMKRSSIWAAIELNRLYKKTPHFAPLKNAREDCREALAIGHIVAYENLTQTVMNLQLNVPINIIENSLDILAELETHGFDVGAMKARLNELHVCKVKVSELEEMVKLFEEDLEMHNGEKAIHEKKIKKLQEKLSEKVAVKIMNDEAIEKLLSNKLLAKNQIKELEHAFEKSAGSVSK